jgi:hypothetical protein
VDPTGGSTVPPEGAGNNPGVGRTAGGIAGAAEGVLVAALFVVAALELAGGLGFFGPNIRWSKPGRLGGSAGVSGIGVVPAEPFILLEFVVEALSAGGSDGARGGKRGSLGCNLALGGSDSFTFGDSACLAGAGSLPLSTRVMVSPVLVSFTSDK